MGRKLVVNADGAGEDAARDSAILDAAERGIVTSASVVANGSTAMEFVKAARGRLGLGLHVNLTAGTPIGGRHFTLVGPGGQFPSDERSVWKRAVHGQIDPQEVEREVGAQWRRLTALGAVIDHVDSRHHVHVMPGILDGLLNALAMVKAAVHVRIPAEEDPPPDSAPVIDPQMPMGTVVLARRRVRQARLGHGGIASLGAHADTARGAIRPPLRTSDGFAGLAFAAAPGLFLLGEGLKSATGDLVEWMVDAGNAKALAVLSIPAARDAVTAAGFELARFA